MSDKFDVDLKNVAKIDCTWNGDAFNYDCLIWNREDEIYVGAFFGDVTWDSEIEEDLQGGDLADFIVFFKKKIPNRCYGIKDSVLECRVDKEQLLTLEDYLKEFGDDG